MKEDACSRCWGCGQLANSEQREPWVAWTQLPANSLMAVYLNVVRPIPCDACGGTGKGREAARAEDVGNVLDSESVLCILCYDRGWVHKIITKYGSMRGPEKVEGVTLCSCLRFSVEEAKGRHALVCGCSLPWIRWDDAEVECE